MSYYTLGEKSWLKESYLLTQDEIDKTFFINSYIFVLERNDDTHPFQAFGLNHLLFLKRNKRSSTPSLF